ncbi:hypothetical protein LXA47_26390 [Massilia sp. P8910]|uniref:hypothetical protein n=1 Tax=Massilia antarctica TaxID=2765360 RepID=UPI001E645F55|nr:hypothetical protein [Massilia antarctica]MCE3607102.1 hypothetical protein [Massilia antarctica]
MDKEEYLQTYKDCLRDAESSALSSAVITRSAPYSAQLSAQVSPCAWLDVSAPFQITVTMADGGKQIVQDRSLHFSQASVADIARLLDQVVVTECRLGFCHRPAFSPAQFLTNREGLCEKCYIVRLGIV